MLEKMLPTLIKALGIEPESLLQNLAQFQGAVGGKIAEFDARIRDVEAQGNRIEQKLDLILASLNAIEAQPAFDQVAYVSPLFPKQPVNGEKHDG